MLSNPEESKNETADQFHSGDGEESESEDGSDDGSDDNSNSDDEIM